MRVSARQRAVWRMQQRLNGEAILNLASAWFLHGSIDPGRIAQAVTRVVYRQRVLLAVYEGPEPSIRLGDPPPLIVRDEDGADPSRINEICREEAARPFEFTNGEQPFRPVLVRLGPNEHILVLVLHLLNCDRRSMTVLLRDLAGAYTAASGGPEPEPLATQYAEIAGDLNDREAEAAWRYWQSRLTDLPELGIKAQITGFAHDDFRACSTDWSVSLARAVRRHCAAMRTTPFTTAATAVLSTLSCRLGVRDVRIATMFLNRVTDQEKALVGPFSQGLMIRANVAVGQPYAAVEATVRRDLLSGVVHRGLPFDEMVERLHAQGMTAGPVAPVWLDVLEPTPDNLPSFGTAVTERFPIADDAPEIPGTTVNLFLEQRENGMRVVAAANCGVFAEGDLEELSREVVWHLSRLTSDESSAIEPLMAVTTREAGIR